MVIIAPRRLIGGGGRTIANEPAASTGPRMTITDTRKLYLAIVALSHPQKSKAASTSSKAARARRDKDVVANVGF